MRRLFLALCLFALLPLCSLPSWGDGCFLPPADYSGKDLREPAQRAVVVYSRGRESLFLFVDYQGDAAQFAWVIPCPSKPTVKTSSPVIWEETAKYYNHLRRLAWDEEMKKRRGRFGVGSAPPSQNEDSVAIHSVEPIGPYEIAILSAHRGVALYEWLTENKYQIPERSKPILGQYVAEQWYFVAVKVQSQLKQLQTLPPLRLDFDASMPYYPLRISSINAGVTDIRLYFCRSSENQPTYLPSTLRTFFSTKAALSQMCPSLQGEFPELDWRQMELGRMTDTLVPQVLQRMDDRLYHRLYDASVLYEPSFYPWVSIAMTVGIAEALMSSRQDEQQWAEQRLHYYYSLEPRMGDVPLDHLQALKAVGTQLGEPLRNKLLDHIETAVRQAKLKQKQFNRPSWASYLGLDSRDSLEGAVKLLAHTSNPDDPKVLTVLESISLEAGSYWIEALCSLNTPASRRALARIAINKGDNGAAFRLIYSLERNPISVEERRIAARELLQLLSKGVTQGDATRRAKRLLEVYTGQDFGVDWMQWERWIQQNM